MKLNDEIDSDLLIRAFAKRDTDWITGEELEKKLTENGCQGDGTRENPYIIDDSRLMGSDTCLKQSDLYLKIIKLELQTWELKICRNISFEECTINSLTLRKSRDVSIASTGVQSLLIFKSGHNRFNNCILWKITHTYGWANEFKNCRLTEIGKKKLLRAISPPILYILLISIIGFFGLLLILSIVERYTSSPNYVIVGILNDIIKIMLIIGMTLIAGFALYNLITMINYYVRFKRNPNRIT